MSPKIILLKSMFKCKSNDIVFGTCTNILSLKSSVKLHGGLINHDRGSTSVEGGAARESHPTRGAAVKPSYHKTPPLPPSFCISSLYIYFLRFISHTRSLATTPRASSFGGLKISRLFPSFSHKTSHSGE